MIEVIVQHDLQSLKQKERIKENKTIKLKKKTKNEEST